MTKISFNASSFCIPGNLRILLPVNATHEASIIFKGFEVWWDVWSWRISSGILGYVNKGLNIGEDLCREYPRSYISLVSRYCSYIIVQRNEMSSSWFTEFEVPWHHVMLKWYSAQVCALCFARCPDRQYQYPIFYMQIESLHVSNIYNARE